MRKKAVLVLIMFVLLFIGTIVVHAEEAANDIAAPTMNFTDKAMKCTEILGPNLTKLVHFAFSTLRIIAAIVAIVNGMIIMMPVVVSKDYGSLNKALRKLVSMLIILAIILIFPSLARVVGKLFEFDISCIL